jgi:hypothetical protein
MENRDWRLWPGVAPQLSLGPRLFFLFSLCARENA